MPFIRIKPSNLDSSNDFSSFVGSAYGTANSAAAYANAAYLQANAAFVAANSGSGATAASSYANSAYITANAAFAKANSSGGIKFTTSNNSPSSPTIGEQWYSLTDDVLFEYINDGSSNVWVDITSSALSSQSTPTISTSSGATDWSIVFLTSGI